MKILSSILVLLISICFFSCNSSKRTEEVASYAYVEQPKVMSDELKANLPDWVQDGKVCYGLIIQINTEKVPVSARPIKAKVVQVNENAIKMKALESIKMKKKKSCSGFMVSKGETWDETAGQLYLTREEAVNALKEMNLYEIDPDETVDL
ncbi:MAG TPA: hypothetical protein VEP89_16365 [Draconibacterium sp.]|nr:hypothetical protein [Draconibacterium sp.]